MGAVQHIIKTFPSTGLKDPSWAPYYMQTNGFWAGDTTLDNVRKYYEDAYSIAYANYYVSSGAVLSNVPYQGNVSVLMASFIFPTLRDYPQKIYFDTWNPVDSQGVVRRYGVPDTVKMDIISSSSINYVYLYSKSDLAAIGTTWEEISKANPNAVREIYNDPDIGDVVIGIESTNLWRSKTTFKVSFQISNWTPETTATP